MAGLVKDNLRVQLMAKSRYEAADARRRPIVERDAGPQGLRVALCYEAYPLITYPTHGELALMDTTEDEAFVHARIQTVRQMRRNKGLIQRHGPVTLTFFDNDVPGFTGTRLLFPEAICPFPQPGRRAFVCAFDRDLLVVAQCAQDEDAAALHLLWQVKLQREGYPGPLLPNTPLSMLPNGRLVPVEFKKRNMGLVVPLR